jgi:hypothetical protein
VPRHLHRLPLRQRLLLRLLRPRPLRPHRRQLQRLSRPPTAARSMSSAT